jgi:DNA-binding Lrp family transcriptional regulator
MEKNMPLSLIDETDCAILNLLQKNGRVTNVKLAKTLHMSETPCWRRLNRLENTGIIKGFQANLNRELLGLGVFAFVQICFASHTAECLDDFERGVQDIPEVLSCHLVSGEADYLLQVVIENLDAYEQFLRKVIRNFSGVSSVKSSLSLREIKDTRNLPLGRLAL